MKRTIVLFFIVLLSANMFAQVQQGIVRTAGRAHHPGKVVSDVIIRVDGAHNAVASAEDGTFSIRFLDMKEGGLFRLSSVKKPNYEILDKGLIGRSLAFSSSVPMTIVLLDKNEMEQERQEITSRFEQTYAANYNRRIKEIEEQYNNKIISLEQKIEALEETDNMYEKIQSQMKEMVEHYVRTDYDVLDSIDREINRLIELGEFEKAKAKILAKGNINERVQTILEMQEQVARNEASLQRLQQQQAQLNSQVNASQGNLLKDLKNLYDIAITNYQIDSAQVLMNHMLAIAPDDLETLREAAWYNLNWRASYLTALRYSQKYLTAAQTQYSDSSEAVIRGEWMEAHVYTMKYALDSALLLFYDIVPKLRKHADEAPFNEWLYSVYVHMAYTYNRKNEPDSALHYYQKAHKELKKRKRTENIEAKEAEIYEFYSRAYRDKKQYKKALGYHRKSMSYYVRMRDSSRIAESYIQKAYIYMTMDSANAALYALRTSLTYLPNASTPRDFSNVGHAYSIMVGLYMEKQQYDSALVYQNLQMTHRLSKYTTHNKAYIVSRLSRAEIYTALNNFDAALSDYNAAVNDMIEYHSDDPYWIGICYRDRGGFYEKTGEAGKALADYEKALEYFKHDSSVPSWHIEYIEKRIQNCKANQL